MGFWIPAFAGMTDMQRSPPARTTEGMDSCLRVHGGGLSAGITEGMGPRIREDNGGVWAEGGFETPAPTKLTPMWA